jgi:tRNA-modifying protein YgfZ
MAKDHYGDPLIEMRAFVRGEAYVDVSDHDIVRVTGPDRLVWLNSLITQLVLDLGPGVTKESLILDPHGHIEHAFVIADDGETIWLLTGPGRGEALATWLTSMVFRMQVSVTHAPGAWRIYASAQPLELAQPLIVLADPWPRVGEGSRGYAPAPHPGADWSVHYSVFPVDAPAPLTGLREAGAFALAGLAIAAGRPSLADVDAKSLPHELDWLRTAVHLNKGCYRGQETVAKVHNLGHPPRRLTLLHLDGSESVLPVAGDVVMNDEKEVGVITRAAWHWELGPVALALLKRTTDVSAVLSVPTGNSVVPATQEVLVPPDAGATRGVPRLPRLGARG